MSSITLTNVTKRYGSLTTVDALNLDIHAGEFLAFLGPSGCGKTTTLRMIAGLALPDGGSIHFGGRDVSNLPPYARNAGLVLFSVATRAVVQLLSELDSTSGVHCTVISSGQVIAGALVSMIVTI